MHASKSRRLKALLEEGLTSHAARDQRNRAMAQEVCEVDVGQIPEATTAAEHCAAWLEQHRPGEGWTFQRLWAGTDGRTFAQCGRPVPPSPNAPAPTPTPTGSVAVSSERNCEDASSTTTSVEPLPDDYQAAALAALPSAAAELVGVACARAAGNGAGLLEALWRAPAAQREAVAFVIAAMPEHDLTSLSGSFILDNAAERVFFFFGYLGARRRRTPRGPASI